MNATAALVQVRPPAAVEILDARPIGERPVTVYLRSLSPGSRPSIQSALRQVLAAMGAPGVDPLDFPWHQLRYSETAALRSVLADAFAPATGNRALAAVRGVLRECWRLGLMSHEEMARAGDLAAIRGSRLPAGRFVEPGEQRALFAACAADPSPAGRRDAVVLALGFGAGLRRAEMASLTGASYDADHGRVRVVGKGRKERMVPLPAGARAAIEAWLVVLGDRATPEAPLLRAIGKSGSIADAGISGQSILVLLAKRAEQAGVPPLRPHDLRRSYVSDALDSGSDLAVVQALAGHASPVTTSRYDRRGERAQSAAAERLQVPYVAPVAS